MQPAYSTAVADEVTQSIDDVHDVLQDFLRDPALLTLIPDHASLRVTQLSRNDMIYRAVASQLPGDAGWTALVTAQWAATAPAAPAAIAPPNRSAAGAGATPEAAFAAVATQIA